MPVMLLIRPEAARIGPQPGGWVVDGVVGERSFRGAQTRLQVTPARAPEMTLTLEDGVIVAEGSPDHG